MVFAQVELRTAAFGHAYATDDGFLPHDSECRNVGGDPPEARQAGSSRPMPSLAPES